MPVKGSRSGIFTTCNYCGETIYVYPYQLKKFKFHYCNAECRGKGHEPDEETRKKLGKSHLGQPSWNKGLRKETDPRVKRMAESLIGRPSYRKGMSYEEEYGEKRAREIKEKLTGHIAWSKGLTKETDSRIKRGAERRTGRPSHRRGVSFDEEYGEERTEEIKEKLSQSHIGQVPWNRGLTVETDERVRIKAENQLGRAVSPETKEILSIRAIEGYENGRINPMKGKKRSDEWKLNQSLVNRGRVPSAEARQKQSESMKLLYLNHPEKHPNARMRKNKKMTKIERLTKEFFERLGFKMGEDFVYQYLVVCSRGTKWIDFYFPKFKLGIECDGSYWHQDKEKDKKRDEEILSFLGEGNIIEHLTEKEIFSLRYLQGVKHV